MSNKKYKHSYRAEQHRQNGKRESSGLFTFGLFVVIIGWGLSYVFNIVRLNDISSWCWAIGTVVGILFMFAGNLLNKKTSLEADNYIEYHNQQREKNEFK